MGARRRRIYSPSPSCPHCGYVAQRDVNAAKVILSRVNARGGQPQSNASRDVPSTSIGRKTCKSKERQ